MQNLKGVIKAFTIILIFACLLQLSFTFLARSVESDAAAYAQKRTGTVTNTLTGDAAVAYSDSIEKLTNYYRRGYLDSVQGLSIISGWEGGPSYRFCRDNSLKLGLDLKGGMSLILEIREDEVLRKLSYNNRSQVFNQAITNAVKAQSSNADVDFLTLFQKEFEALNKDGKIAAIFAPVEAYQGKINFNSTNAEVIAVLRADMKSAISNTFQVLKTRIDQFGVASPNISLQENSGRIILELPGVEDPTRVRKLLQQTAQLEFWDCYDNREVVNFMVQAFENAKTLNAIKKVEDTTAVAAVADSAKQPMSLIDSLSMAADKDSTGKKDSLDKTVSPLARLLELRVSREGEVAEGPIVGLAMGNDTAAINRILANQAVRSAFPPDLKLLWGIKPFMKDSRVYAMYAIKANPSTPEAPLTGDVIKDASQGHDPVTGTFTVNMRMNSMGASKWEKLTEAAVTGNSINGKDFKRSVAIVLDSRVISAPTVQQKISGGSSEINGLDDLEEALDLSNILKSGKLEARTVVIEEQIVGPSLGKESIRAGLLSLAVGFLLVFIFMIGYYSTSGIIANAAMLLNLFILVCALISFGAAFTLPAMAGIILTLAMAVDANVIINERIREEIHRGKGMRLAVEEGYQHSYSAIVDGNLTTMVVSIVLMVFGLGPIYGFGFTLFVGLLTSLFTAVLVSHLIFDWAFNKGYNVQFGKKFTSNLFKGTQIDFIGKKKISYSISIIVFLISLASIFTLGFDFGVDFKGGRSYVVQFDKDVTTEQISGALEKELDGAPIVKTYGSSNTVSITTAYMIDATGENTDSIIEAKIYNGVKSIYGKTPVFDDFRVKNVKSSIKVEASVADDIRSSAWKAILFGLGGVFLYILLRFRRFEYATGAIVALIHDPILILGIFSLFKGIMPFSLEIDQNIVAAILTLIGYSVNDTVVVFDRIREFIGLHPTRTLEQNVNDSINSTLSRTIMTVFTVFVVSLVLFLFGGTPIRGFSFALIIGLLVGTYSSIFIASPVMVDLWNRKTKKA
ncbi:MAG: protein translocase subunit SecDF [Bacteroidetes bacterium]|nr:protein translocase subunit SecDF [Bacteroidota bacterium]